MNARMFLTVLATLLALAPPRADAQRLTAAEVERFARPLVDEGWYTGLVVGVLDEDGPRVTAYGRKLATDADEPDGDTLFEIGSITKSFTGVLLAEMVGRGEVALDDPVARYLPDGVTVPQIGPRPITLADLATHTSGLPRMPDNFRPADANNPYADYTVERMYAFLKSCKPARLPGAGYEYSNLGMGLLGHVLVRRAGARDYEALLTERVLRPLGMSDTRVALDDAARTRLAHGHNADGEPVANWDLPTFAGAGALRSSANDMLKYVAANLRLAKGPLDDAFELAHTPRAPLAPGSVHEIGLAWHSSWKGKFVWHNGATGGYASFCGFVPARKAGFVVLANTTSGSGAVDQVGFALGKLLIGETAKPPTLRKTVKVAPTVLDKRVGRYVMPLVLDSTVTREGERLYCQIPGQQKFGIYPESETDFFYKAADAQITFTLDKAGRAFVATLHQRGATLPALRADGKPTTLPAAGVD